MGSSSSKGKTKSKNIYQEIAANKAAKRQHALTERKSREQQINRAQQLFDLPNTLSIKYEKASYTKDIAKISGFGLITKEEFKKLEKFCISLSGEVFIWNEEGQFAYQGNHYYMNQFLYYVGELDSRINRFSTLHRKSERCNVSKFVNTCEHTDIIVAVAKSLKDSAECLILDEQLLDKCIVTKEIIRGGEFLKYDYYGFTHWAYRLDPQMIGFQSDNASYQLRIIDGYPHWICDNRIDLINKIKCALSDVVSGDVINSHEVERIMISDLGKPIDLTNIDNIRIYLNDNHYFKLSKFKFKTLLEVAKLEFNDNEQSATITSNDCSFKSEFVDFTTKIVNGVKYFYYTDRITINGDKHSTVTVKEDCGCIDARALCLIVENGRTELAVNGVEFTNLPERPRFLLSGKAPELLNPAVETSGTSGQMLSNSPGEGEFIDPSAPEDENYDEGVPSVPGGP